jgi:AcrR family transcriptional regulator
MLGSAEGKRHRDKMAIHAQHREHAFARAGERERIGAALIDLCLERGFPAVTVEDLCARAEVPLALFEAEYDGLEDCFCQTLEAQRDDFFDYLDRAVAVTKAERWADRVRTVAYGLLRYLRDDRARAHFLTVELNRAGERAMLIWTETIVKPLFDLIDEGRREPGAPASLTRATAEQVGGGIFARIYAATGKGELDLPGRQVVPQLMYTVVLPYLGAQAAAEELAAPPPPLLSGESKDERIREALLDLCYEHGFAEVTAEELCRRAGVDRAVFDRRYTDLEECFLHFYEPEMQSFCRRMTSAGEGHAGWRDRLRATAYDLLRFIREDERRTSFVMVEARAGGERAQLIFAEGIKPLFDLVDEGRQEMDDPDSLSRSTAEQIAGGIFNEIYAAVGRRESFEVGPKVIPQMMYVAVLPYLGHDVAVEELSIPPPPEFAQ